MNLNDTTKYQLAKSLTELAIQNNLFYKYEDSVETAKSITVFFDTIVTTVVKSDKND